MNTIPIPEFMVRVKLPDSGAFHSSPSGDNEYEEAYNKAIFDVKPVGFEVIWPRTNEKWPVDSEGFTWVRLRLSDEKAGLAYWIKTAHELQKQLIKIKETIKKVL